MLPHVVIQSYQQAKRFVIIVIGFTVLLIGVVLIALPGPAILVIPLGLAILATEFIWAKKLLFRFKKTVTHLKSPRRVRLLLFAKTKVSEKFSNLFRRKQSE
jgi:tellurite resistance protein TerC